MASLKIGQTTIKTVIFDFDGTLAKLTIDFSTMRSDIEALVASYRIIPQELKTTFVLETIVAAHDLIRRQSAQQADAFFSRANRMIEDIETQGAQNGHLFGWTKDLLESLQAAKISCGIITRNCVRAVNMVFPDILTYCPVVVCRDDVRRVKPHPEHIRLALDRLGALPDNTLMVGDHPIDITTGRNARTLTCGVLTGRCPKENFVAAGADLVLGNAAEILSILKIADG